MIFRPPRDKWVDACSVRQHLLWSVAEPVKLELLYMYNNFDCTLLSVLTHGHARINLLRAVSTLNFEWLRAGIRMLVLVDSLRRGTNSIVLRWFLLLNSVELLVSTALTCVWPFT